MDSRERFTAAAPAYRDHRPSYPDELLDWIAAAAGVTPPARIADVGCGTGIATRRFAARGFTMIGIEPNPAMRALAEAAGGAEYRAGEAAATGLADGAVALVICAQAFHYFDVAATLAEWRRVLVPGGACAVFWYRIAPSPLKDEYHWLRRRHARPGTAGGGYRTAKQDIAATLAAAPGVRALRTARFAGHQDLECDGLVGRLEASSRLGGGSPALAADAASLFARHQDGGRLRLPLEITGIVWQFE